MIVIVMGVSGSGKTTVGRALAKHLNATFLDADDFHPPQNVRKMSRSESLTDEDRRPWLDAMRQALAECEAKSQHVVLACSALKQAYRERLSRGLSTSVHWVHLHADFQTLHERMEARKDHYMPASLLRSQFDTLEQPNDAITIDVSASEQEVIDDSIRRLEQAIR